MRMTLQHRKGIAGLDLSGSDLDFLTRLGGPTTIELPGSDRKRTRVVVTLLHGNEPSGLRAVQSYLRSGAVPAVNFSFIIGNVEAGLVRRRMLPGRPDLNRCFFAPFIGPYGELARDVLAAIERSGCEALLDIHNNSDHNPAYGVGTAVDGDKLALTSLFARLYVHSDLRLGALMDALGWAFPMVTIESGRAGDPVADELALAGLCRFASNEHVVGLEVDCPPIGVLTDSIRVRIRDGYRLAFANRADPEADLTMALDVDRHNFQMLAAGDVVAWLGARDSWPILALDASGNDRSNEVFVTDGSTIRMRVERMPIMMTTDVEIARSDCLFYLVSPVAEPPTSR